MKHLGDITKIKGSDVPLVDIVCGGSPCQDLSVAGKREGLAGARSGLFMEQIRIIKEMRDESIRKLQMRGADVDFRCVQPRYMVWENVPGAFSSNGGEDFRAVLEETARVADKDATIPRLEKGGRWSTSGCIMADGWSIAWRVHDAQFWGVPQRRKRIALVADFAGQSAPEILFERKGVSRNIEESNTEREAAAGSIGESVDRAISFQERAGKSGGGKGILIQHERVGALSTLNNQSVMKCLGLDRASFNQGQNAQYNFSIQEELAPTLISKGPGGGTSQTIGALCARDYKGIGNQYVAEGKCIMQDLLSENSSS